MAISAAEQLLIELINRGRLDPAAEAERYGVSLNADLVQGAISTKAKEVLAPDAHLEKAAIAHSNWMLKTDNFSHTGVYGSNPSARMEKAGYDFSGTYSWRENLAWVGSTNSVSLEKTILEHHVGLYRSESHRVNTFAEDIREIGVAQVSGAFTQNGVTYKSSMLTENFAKTGNDTFVTGVAYQDKNGNKFYGIGEGLGNVWFRGGGDGDRTPGSGGYALDVGDRDSVTVTIGRFQNKIGKVELDTSDGNGKLDFVATGSGREVHLSGSADLMWGLRDARLLGVNNLDLSGSGGRNDLWGNDGRNTIHGEGRGDRIWGNKGDDKLFGDRGYDMLDGGFGRDKLFVGGQNDRLFGGAHNDRLDGGNGNDKLTGGGGADTFVFKSGDDIIRDFENNIDTIAIKQSLMDDGDTSISDLMDCAQIVNDDAVFTFDGGHTLTIDDVSNLNVLANDLTLI
jgi:Ca2+-binding RTX toxin-like protein